MNYDFVRVAFCVLFLANANSRFRAISRRLMFRFNGRFVALYIAFMTANKNAEKLV